ncbi:MAG TPA: hypothetical protein VIM79_22095 [Niastella sp.]
MHPYHFNDHRHRYAVWTAARAVQRNFTITTAIREAIESSDLRDFMENEKEYNQIEFDAFHKTCAGKIIDSFKNQGIENVSYGRAAKIIAIYLKTTVVLCNKATCTKSDVIHPPVDRILLQNLAKTEPGLKELADKNWTMFDLQNYWQTVELIRSRFGSFNWRLEEFWEV